MVANIVKKGLDAINSKQTNIFSAAFFIILTTIVSQLLGVLKYRLLVSYFGASNQAGVFLASFRIPDFISIIFVGGALSSAFIPVFSELYTKKGRTDAFVFASSLTNLVTLGYLAVSGVIFLFAYQFATLLSPHSSPQELTLLANLMRIIQLSQVFFIIGSIFTATLQSFQHFLVPGIATSLYNLGIIIGLILFAPVFGIYGAAVGVLIGSLLFCFVQIPLLGKSGFHFFPSINFVGLKKFFRLMSPTLATTVAIQIAATANVYFALLLSARSYVIFDLAQTLMMGPVLLFGQSIAQASFPALVLNREKRSEFLSIFTSSFDQILYLTLPISALFIVLRIPVVRLFFGARGFDWPATVATGLTLAFFSLSMFSQALLYLLLRTFYSFQDTRRPFFITIFGVAFNILISFIFISIYHLPIYYLAIAYSISSVATVAIMLFLIHRAVSLPVGRILFSTFKIVVATLVMGAALYIPIKLLDQLVFDTTRTINLLILTGIASAAGFAAYVFLTWLLDIREAYYIIEVAKSLRNKDRILKQVGELINGPKLNA